MAAPRVLALDIGTSSVRASLCGPDLKPRTTVQLGYRWIERPDGRVELDAGRLERLVIQAVDGVLAQARAPVAAVAVAAFWHSLVGADGAGRALTPVLPWSDTRAADDVIALRGELDERRLHAVTGCRLHASYWPARLRWYRRTDRRLFTRIRRWMSFTELLELRWLGRQGVSLSQASGTGIFRQDSCRWDDGLLERCGLSPEHLAPLVDLEDRQAELSPSLARRWPALARAIWLPAVGDGAANNAGAGCATRGRAALMIGTSGALRVLWRPRAGERVCPSYGLWRYRLDRDRVVVGGALSNGGNVRSWSLRTFGADPAALERDALALAPDAHGLTLLPHLAGARSPHYLPHATGAVDGITLATTPAHIHRALLEAVAFSFGRVFDELRAQLPIREIVAAGGALTRSPAWTEIIADVLNRPVRLTKDREMTTRGAAALAFEQLGQLRLEELDPPSGRVLRPDAARHRAYAAAMRRQAALLARRHDVMDASGRPIPSPVRQV